MGFAIHSDESARGVHVSPILSHPPTSHPIPSLRVIPVTSALSTLSHALNLDWWSISHMVIYMFQCYSLRSSQRHLLPQSPKVRSLQLCLFCCLAYRVILTIFLSFFFLNQKIYPFYWFIAIALHFTILCRKYWEYKLLCKIKDKHWIQR